MPKANLVELYAHKLGVIDDARLEFGSGFNVITGETGAGKTLLLGALGLCLGGDASNSRYALTAETRGPSRSLSATATNSPSRERSATPATTQLPQRRTVERGGAAHLAEDLIVIHGQHDSLTLRSRSEVLRLIDERGGVDPRGSTTLRRDLREALRLRSDYGGDQCRARRESEFLLSNWPSSTRRTSARPNELDETLEELIVAHRPARRTGRSRRGAPAARRRGR